MEHPVNPRWCHRRTRFLGSWPEGVEAGAGAVEGVVVAEEVEGGATAGAAEEAAAAAAAEEEEEEDEEGGGGAITGANTVV